MPDYSKINFVKSIVNKRGQKMWYYYSEGAKRWIRLKSADAELLKATGQVADVTNLDIVIF